MHFMYHEEEVVQQWNSFCELNQEKNKLVETWITLSVKI